MLSTLPATQRSEAARFIRRLACFLPLVFAPAIGNWILETPVVARWEMPFVVRAADEMLQGRSVLLTPCDRPLKFALIDRLPAPKSVLVFGGSRASQISPAWFEPDSALNLAVTEGGVDDAVSLFQKCLEAHKLPSLVVLELDAALVRKRLPRNWAASAGYFNRALARYGLVADERSGHPLSLDRIRAMLRFFAGTQWRAVRADDPRYHLLPDGTLCVPFDQRNRAPSQIDPFVTGLLGNIDAVSYLRWRTSSPGEFEKSLLRHFLGRSSFCIIFGSLCSSRPFIPSRMSSIPNEAAKDESWIRAEMASRGITIAGSYSPFVTGATSGDFYDDVHPRAPLVYRLLREAGVVGPLPQVGRTAASGVGAPRPAQAIGPEPTML